MRGSTTRSSTPPASYGRRPRKLGGGYFALPGRVFVGLYGKPGDPESGMLGRRAGPDAVGLISQTAERYGNLAGLPGVPTLEVVAVQASDEPGDDKNYADELPMSELEPLLTYAEQGGLYVLLTFETGKEPLLDQAKRYQEVLERPHVGISVQPEPGDPTAAPAQLAGLIDWLAELTSADALPQKLVTVHASDEAELSALGPVDSDRPEIAIAVQIDRIGDPASKIAEWEAGRAALRADTWVGWTQFEREDDPMFTVNYTWKNVQPFPNVISYR